MVLYTNTTCKTINTNFKILTRYTELFYHYYFIDVEFIF